MRSSAWDGENAAPSAKGTATATTRAIWQHRRAASKISRFPAIGKGNSTRRPLNATVVMNLTLPKDSPRCACPARARDIRGGSRPNVAGSRWKSPARSVASTKRLPSNLKPGVSAGGLEHWRIVYLDGVHFSIRHGDQCDSTSILTALGMDLAGNKEVLALGACAEEDKDGWACLLHDLRSRGATHIDLFVTDGHDGRLSAVSEQFTATARQRCLVHKQRNVLTAIPRRERADVQAELVGIWKQPTKEEALTCLAAFKAKYALRYPEAVRSLAEDEEHLLTF
jgi:Transposase, Mutator family